MINDTYETSQADDHEIQVRQNFIRFTINKGKVSSSNNWHN